MEWIALASTALGALQTCFDDSCTILQSQGATQLAAGNLSVRASPRMSEPAKSAAHQSR